MVEFHLNANSKPAIPKYIIYSAIIFAVFRLVFSFCLELNIIQYDGLGIKLNPNQNTVHLIKIISDNNKTLKMNTDEERNYSIAENHFQKNGYTVYDIKNKMFRKTAYHGSFTVFLYEWLIKNLADFDVFILGVLCLSSVFHFFELLAFYCIISNLTNKKYNDLGFYLYALFPSVIFFIGALFAYENIALSCLVIGVYLLYTLIKKQKNYLSTVCFVLLIAIISICLRAQTLPLWVLIFLFNIFFSKYSNRVSQVIIFGLFILLVFFAYIPVLQKNKSMFGEYVISTQFGYELYQGANPMARGSWDGSGKTIEKALVDVKDKASLSELDISHLLKKKALTWIFNHPKDYTVLLARKLAIFFLPKNYEVLPFSSLYNPVNTIVYLGFILFVFSQFKKPEFSRVNALLLAPIIGSLTLSLIFFTGYRWRYYAEPFMIILSITWLQSFIQNKKIRNRSKHVISQK